MGDDHAPGASVFMPSGSSFFVTSGSDTPMHRSALHLAWLERHSGRILAAGALVTVNIVIVAIVTTAAELPIIGAVLVSCLAVVAFLLLHRSVGRLTRSAVGAARREGLVARQMMLAVEQIGSEPAGLRGTIEALCSSAQGAGLEVFMWDAQERTLWSPAWEDARSLSSAEERALRRAFSKRGAIRVGDATQLGGPLPTPIGVRGACTAYVAAPMWSSDEFHGIVLRRYRSAVEMHRAGDDVLVASIAALGAVSIGKALVVDSEQQRVRDNELLLRSVHAASESRQRDRLVEHVQQAAEAVRTDRAALFALEQGRLRLTAAVGIERIHASGAGSVRMRSGLVDRAHEAGASPFGVRLGGIDEPSRLVLERLGFADELIVVALRDPNGIVGLIVLNGCHDELNGATDSLITAVAHQASMAIERTRLTRSIRKRSRHLACTPKLARNLTGQRDPDAVARIAARELHEGFGFGRVSIALLTNEAGVPEVGGDQLRIIASSGERAASGVSHIGCTDALAECVQTGRPYVSVCGDLEDDLGDVAGIDGGPRDNDAPAGCRGRIVVPIAGRDRKVVGAIAVYERDAETLGEDDLHMLETIADQLGGTIEQAALFASLERSYFETVEALSSALEAKDAYTLDHARSITDMSADVGRRLGMREDEIRDLKLGALLHDIGKIGVPTEILSKPGPLTDAEFEVMKEHTVIGEQIIASVEFLQSVRPLVLHEHERWDGMGYPHQLKGEEIPLGARIIFVCDSWHAMTSDRPYRKALPEAEAIRRLREGASSQFDPAVVEAFCEIMAQHEADDAATQQRPNALVIN